MNVTTLDRSQLTNLVRFPTDPFETRPTDLGSRSWQLSLLSLAVLQLKLPARAFTTPVIAAWNHQTLQCLVAAQPPQAVALILAIVQTCGYDAWSAYDAVAIGTQLGGSLRRPAAERTAENRAKAFSYGAYRALLDLFPQFEQQARIRDFMRRLGYDPDDASTDTTTPAGIGNVAAAAVLDSVIRKAPVRWVI